MEMKLFKATMQQNFNHEPLVKSVGSAHINYPSVNLAFLNISCMTKGYLVSPLVSLTVKWS